jgi:hypothetical protein
MYMYYYVDLSSTSLKYSLNTVLCHEGGLMLKSLALPNVLCTCNFVYVSLPIGGATTLYSVFYSSMQIVYFNIELGIN